MATVLSIANQKGGVGKTTTAVNLSASLTSINKRVLLIDMDPQGNATMGCGIDKYSLTNSICEVLLDESNVNESITQSEGVGIDLIPSNTDLVAAEVALLKSTRSEFKLKDSCLLFLL